MSAAPRRRNLLSLDGRVPPVVGALILATTVVSILGAPGLGLGVGRLITTYGVLVPGDVLHGQVWRLVTWVLFAGSPIGLLFTGLSYYWFGRDLVDRWGTTGLLWRLAGAAAGSGLLVVGGVLALYGDGGRLQPFIGAGAVSTALIVCWALLHPDRTINFFMVMPVQSKMLVVLVLGMTALSAAFYGMGAVLPELAAEVMSLGYMYRGKVLGPLRARFTRKPPRRPPTQFQVWDEKKQSFRPPKWMN